jgi:hypothetical protein
MANEKFDISQLSPGVLKAFDRPDFQRYDITPDKLEQISPETLPYTRFGLDDRNQGIASLPPLAGKTLGGFTTWDKNIPGSSFIAIGPDKESTPAHEIEHALEKQSGANLNSEWDRLVRSDSFTFKPEDRRPHVVDRMLEHSDYLQKHWGVDPNSSYFGKDAKERYGNTYAHLLNEQLASIVPWELKHNKKFTDDPYVRENILTTPAQRETYNALTGLRQSRLDAKDLPPYTRQPEKGKPAPEPGVLDKLYYGVKSKLGYKSGGFIDKPIKGGVKSI